MSITFWRRRDKENQPNYGNDITQGVRYRLVHVLRVCKLNYLILNYLRLIYAQFLTSFLTTIFIFLSTWLITTISDLQPSTAIANQLPGQLVSTQIRTCRPNCFKFIIALIMTSTNIVWIDEWLSDSVPFRS